MRLTTALSVLALLAAALLLAGCAETVQSRSHPGLASQREPIESVAVAPFRASGDLLNEPLDSDHDLRGVLSLTAHHVTEAIVKKGLSVVPADDVARALGGTPRVDERLIPLRVARAVHAEFGADAVLIGEAWQFVEREGEGAGARTPASVGFEVTLYSAPGAARLWTGTFDETQRAFGENVLQTTQYPGGGMRWLTAEELLRWGAEQTALAMPIGSAPAPRR